MGQENQTACREKEQSAGANPQRKGQHSQVETHKFSAKKCTLLKKKKKNTENFRNKKYRPGTVAHTCNPNILGGRGGRITWSQELETSRSNTARPPSLQKLKCEPVVVAYTCSSSYLGGCGRRIPQAQEFKAAAAVCSGMSSAHCNLYLLGSTKSELRGQRKSTRGTEHLLGPTVEVLCQNPKTSFTW
ncbi:hypothetical protein AAY473_020028 [Plecturocebus cupreus]